MNESYYSLLQSLPVVSFDEGELSQKRFVSGINLRLTKVAEALSFLFSSSLESLSIKPEAAGKALEQESYEVTLSYQGNYFSLILVKERLLKELSNSLDEDISQEGVGVAHVVLKALSLIKHSLGVDLKLRGINEFSFDDKARGPENQSWFVYQISAREEIFGWARVPSEITENKIYQRELENLPPKLLGSLKTSLALTLPLRLGSLSKIMERKSISVSRECMLFDAQTEAMLKAKIKI